MEILFAGAISFLFGALGVFLWLYPQKTKLKAMLEGLYTQIEDKEKTAHLLEQQLSDHFKALSSQALHQNNQLFLDLAKESFQNLQQQSDHQLKQRQEAIQNLVMPVKESLTKIDEKIHLLEKSRIGAYEGLKQQVVDLIENQKHLLKETNNLTKALKNPHVRGRWGELQLKRVVELAGMVNYCDFVEQTQVTNESGKSLRPDMIVKLPGQKQIIIDAKTPLDAYLDAQAQEDDYLKEEDMVRHLRHLKEHIKQLSSKSYWSQFESTPEFVVMFLPGEHFFSAALKADPGLIESGIENNVILATPTTLIALLRAVAYGWRQENMAENARKINDLGAELYKRVSDMTGHFADLGSTLEKAVDRYNKTMASYESRVLVSAKKMYELQAMEEKAKISDLKQVEKSPRHLQKAS